MKVSKLFDQNTIQIHSQKKVDRRKIGNVEMKIFDVPIVKNMLVKGIGGKPLLIPTDCMVQAIEMQSLITNVRFTV